MALVLGIDASWTATGSSGVALVQYVKGERRVVAVAPSYAGFISNAEMGGAVNWVRPTGDAPDVPSLLEAANKLGGAPVDVVAIDMPMALTDITERRIADNKISEEFGAACAGTHSVNPSRPGPFGKSIRDAFRKAGYSLATVSRVTARPALIEAFPLAALVRLMGLNKRPPYKVTKTAKYWEDKTREERRDLLSHEWSCIVLALQSEISEIGFAFPIQWSTWTELKPYEDVLDAVISAWVGTCFLDNTAQPFGDSSAAIWVPKARAVAPLTR